MSVRNLKKNFVATNYLSNLISYCRRYNTNGVHLQKWPFNNLISMGYSGDTLYDRLHIDSQDLSKRGPYVVAKVCKS